MTSDAPKKEIEQKPFVADYLLFLLASASHGASAEFHATVRDHGLRVPEWRVLACLHDEDGLPITQLARLSLMEQSRLTKVVDQMHEKTLVTRSRDGLDRRKVRVFLTENGRKQVNALIPLAQDHEQMLLAGLPGGKGPELKEAIKALYKHVHN